MMNTRDSKFLIKLFLQRLWIDLKGCLSEFIYACYTGSNSHYPRYIHYAIKQEIGDFIVLLYYLFYSKYFEKGLNRFDLLRLYKQAKLK